MDLESEIQGHVMSGIRIIARQLQTYRFRDLEVAIVFMCYLFLTVLIKPIK